MYVLHGYSLAAAQRRIQYQLSTDLGSTLLSSRIVQAKAWMCAAFEQRAGRACVGGREGEEDWINAGERASACSSID